MMEGERERGGRKGWKVELVIRGMEKVRERGREIREGQENGVQEER